MDKHNQIFCCPTRSTFAMGLTDKLDYNMYQEANVLIRNLRQVAESKL